jgi:hypothetical protein
MTSVLWVQFTPNHKDYSIEIKSTTKYKNQSFEKGYVDVYTVPLDGDVNKWAYTVSIVKGEAELLFNNDDELGQYLEDYLKTCNCSLKNQRVYQFKNFEAIVFDMEKSKNNGYELLYGESIHFVKNGGVYNVNYLSDAPGKAGYMTEFDWIINSMKFN